MENLALLFLILGLVTVVGHGIWLLLAALWAELFVGSEAARLPRSGQGKAMRCPGCGLCWVRRGDTACPTCGLLHPGRVGLAAQQGELDIAMRQIRGLQARGELDDDTAQRLRHLLEERQRLLRGEVATAKARAEPVIQPGAIHGKALPSPSQEALPDSPLRAPVPEPAPVPVVAASLPVAEAVPAPNPPPRQRFSGVLGGFMEERNILWGELVGGLLVVGCSLALVLTLWRSLEQLPYFPFLLFTALTAALFGAGQYTLHHWKLTSTSRGLLIIALLLLPLNLLVLGDTSAPRMAAVQALGWVDPLVTLAALLLLAVITRAAGRDLMGSSLSWHPRIGARELLVVAILGTAAVPLIGARLFEVTSAPRFLALAVLTVLCQVGATSAVLAGLTRSVRRAEPARLTAQQASAVLLFLGLGSFALVAAVGFLVGHASGLAAVRQLLAGPLTVVGVPVLAAGLLIHRRLMQPEASGLRTAGTAVALAGPTVMLAGILLAWPSPVPLLLACALAGASLAVVGFRYAPWAHTGGLACLALAVLVVFHLITGQLPAPADANGGAWLARTLTGPASGVVLAGLALFLTGVAEVLARLRRSGDAVAYAATSAGLALLGLLAATCHGIEQPLTAAVVCGLCAVGLLASNQRWQQRSLPVAAVWLVLIGTLWTLQGLCPGRLEWWGLAVAVEALGLVLLAAWLRYQGTPVLQLGSACVIGGSAAGLLALGLGLSAANFPAGGVHAGTAVALALTAFVLAGLLGWPALGWIGTVLGLGAIVHLCVWTVPVGTFPLPLFVAFAAHATVALLASTCRVGDHLRIPLRQSAQFTSILAIFFLVDPGPTAPWVLACDVFWLAILWLVLAIVERSAGWFTGFQAGLGAASLFAVTAWLKRCDWMNASTLGLLDPAALHAYLAGLGLLVLAWTGVRKAAQRRPGLAELCCTLEPGLDRMILGCLVVGQLVLAVVFLVPDLAQELTVAGHPPPLEAPAEFAHGHGFGAWILLVVLALALLATLATTTRREKQVRAAAVLGLLLLFLTVPVLWSGRYAGAWAAASALRWGLACCFALGCGLLCVRRPLARLAFSLRLGPPPRSRTIAGERGILLSALAVVLLLTGAVAWIGFQGQRPSGPLGGSSFAQMGELVSNVVPLALLVLGLAGTAVRDRFPGYAFGASLLATVTVAGGYALGVVTGGGTIQGSEVVYMVLLACLTASVCTLAWLLCRRLLPGWPAIDPLLDLQSVLGLAGLVGLAVPVLTTIVIEPSVPLAPAFAPLAGLGWVVLLLATAASLGYAHQTGVRKQVHTWGTAILIAGALVTCLAAYRDRPGQWVSYHVLAAFWSLTALGLVVALSWHGPVGGRVQFAWLEALAATLLVLALRGEIGDPWTPYPDAGLALVATLLLGAMGLRSRAPRHAYASGIALVIAGLIAWSAWGPDTFSSFVLTVAIGVALASAGWTAMAFAAGYRAKDPEFQVSPGLSFARQASLGALGLLLIAVLENLETRSPPGLLDLAGLEAVGVALVLLLWDRHARLVLPGLWLLGLAAVGLVLRFPAFAFDLKHAAGAGLALHLTLVSVLAWAVASRAHWFRPFGLPPRSPEQARTWLVPAQAGLTALIVLLSIAASLQGEGLALRWTGALAILAAIPGWALLARTWPAFPGLAARYAVVVLGCLALAEAAVALPDPNAVALGVQRTAWLLAALVAGTLACSAEVAWQRQGDWARAYRWVSLYLAALAGLVAILLLVLEVPVFDPLTRRTPITVPALAASLVALVALAWACVRWAVQPQRDPLGPTTPGRSLYVYAAEILVVAIFVQLRLNVPELFLGVLARYWMLFVMLLAFVGIGLGEMFERRGPLVLARPLQRTSIFLPLVPLLAFWARPPAALVRFAEVHAPGLRPFLAYLERIPPHLDAHALIWFLSSALYGLVALSRRSFAWALLAALAANFGIWALLAHAGIAFLFHPQVWLIPLALIILVSEHINRDRVSPEVAAGLRYLALSMIYVASTADLYIAGVGNSVWLPVVLALLAVAGVLAGIHLRVKAFLFLGISFLLVDILTMIWHAAVGLAHTWVWWASGVVLGMLILALFAVFEKRRNDVLRLLEEIRRWA